MNFPVSSVISSLYFLDNLFSSLSRLGLIPDWIEAAFKACTHEVEYCLVDGSKFICEQNRVIKDSIIMVLLYQMSYNKSIYLRFVRCAVAPQWLGGSYALVERKGYRTIYIDGSTGTFRTYQHLKERAAPNIHE